MTHPNNAMDQKIIIFETNEIPLNLFEYYQQIEPNSSISSLLNKSLVLETLARDVNESDLYPSQTWASLNTGAPYKLHQIHWYNDPKSAEFPFYWQTLADQGFTIGLVNTLHSAPVSVYADTDNYQFVIPDCFATDAWTKPEYYQPFQSLNLKATSLNSRTVTLKLPMREALSTILNVPKYGISFKTIFDGADLIRQILLKQVGKERLRNLQFPLISDMFLHLLKKNQPDLAILFTNHVAANMHRYWYALFPNDYDQSHYDHDWIDRYSGEIVHSLAILDDYLSKLMEFSQLTNSILVLVSSMGQSANKNMPEDIQKIKTHDFRLEDVSKIVNKLTDHQFNYRVKSAMVPQYTLEFDNELAADSCFKEIKKNSQSLENICVDVYLNQSIVTLRIILDSNAQTYKIGDLYFTYTELGFSKFKVEDHRSGCHSERGSLIIYNSQTSSATTKVIDYLEFAPAILKYFQIEKSSYAIEPSFTI